MAVSTVLMLSLVELNAVDEKEAKSTVFSLLLVAIPFIALGRLYAKQWSETGQFGSVDVSREQEAVAGKATTRFHLSAGAPRARYRKRGEEARAVQNSRVGHFGKRLHELVGCRPGECLRRRG